MSFQEALEPTGRPTGALYANPRWLLAVGPEGLLGVGPGAELRIDFDAPVKDKQGILELLASGATVGALAGRAGADSEEARGLLGELEQVGALLSHSPEPAPSRGSALIDALLGVEEGGRLPDVVWTAEEALVLPRGLDRERELRLLRAFIAGIEPLERRIAYGHAARWLRPTVLGDVPDPARLDQTLRLPDRDPTLIYVIDLERGSESSLTVDDLERLTAGDTHRLGPVTGVMELDLHGGPRGMHIMLARRATPNLAHPEADDISPWGRGTARSPTTAVLISRAEAAERYAAGDLEGRTLVRARERDLTGAVPGDRIFRFNRRQYDANPSYAPYDPDAEYLWTPARGPDGSERWVLAEAVFLPFQDFERPRRVITASSSGTAAHHDPIEASRRALRELVERDAFMWTWLQRLSRERVAASSLPGRIVDRAGELATAGMRVEFVNLTLETDPVILCAITDGRSLALGAACRDDPGQAAEKSLDEATGLFLAPGDSRPLEPRDVWSPHDHLLLYRERHLAEAEFLFGSPDVIGLGDVNGADDMIEVALTQIGEPLTVDLSSPATRPFRVVRAVVPGLIPISFGWDREPLGMPLLGKPRTTADGRRLGAALDLTAAGPLMPHPFA
jgi:ribosomal protein S12 methylthiotransferase accessory factor